MAHTAPGRHRAPGRINPLSELRLLARESAQPVVKGVAIMAASGGLVASFAAPSIAADDSGAVVAAGNSSVSGVTVAGPATGATFSATALASIGYAAPAARKAKPLVIEDILVKTQRAAKAKADEKAKQEAQARATALVAEKAAADRRAESARSSRSTTRTAVPTRSASPSTSSSSSTSTKTKTSSSSSSSTSTKTKTSSSSTSTKTKTSSNPVPAPAPAPAPAPSSSGITGIAQSLYGIPYVYGGTSTSGFDCSGFTSYVYNRAGISIPRTASAQQRAATRVSNPAPGDLVFFGTPAYHVGIYLGGGRMADSQRPGTVSGNHSIWTTPSGYGRF